MTIRHRLLHYFTTTALLSASLTGVAVVGAPAVSAATCPTGFSLVSGTTDVCELRFTTVGNHSWIVPAEVANIDVLVVGGGGYGGNGSASFGGGGGGGGATIGSTNYQVAAGSSFSITVGRGGRFWQWSSDYSEISLNGSTARLKAFGGNGGSFNGTGEGQGANPGIVLEGFSSIFHFPGEDGKRGNVDTQPTSGKSVTQGLFQFGSAIRVGGGGGGGTSSKAGTTFTGSGFTTNAGGGGGGSQAGYATPSDGKSDGKPGIVVIRTRIQTATAPDAPTSVSALAGAGQATVSWAAPANDGGGAITSYTVTASPGGATASGASSPITVTGLANGTPYTFTVTATNSAGPGATSTPSAPVTPQTTPDAPTITSSSPGDGEVSVSFSAPASDGGAAITNYDYSLDGGVNWTTLSPASTTSPIVVTGLSNGTTYQVQIRARNTVGAGTPTSSVSVTPVATAPAITFSTPIRTADGFTVNVTNHDPDFVWAISPSAGVVTQGAVVGSTLPLTVTGLSAGASATLTVTTTRSGYANRSATVTGQAKSSQTVTWSPTTAVTTVQSPLTPSTPATALGGATIRYSLVSHTTDTCSVDMNSGVVTYTGTGNCVVRATAQATSDYAEGTEDVTFVVSKATQAVIWSPTTSITTTQSPLTPSSATALGGAAISYSKISNTTATCSVDPTSGQLTYTGAGKCVVRATAEATDDYDSGFTDVEFTVSKATPTFTWNPSLTYDVPDGSTTFPVATTNSDGTVSYSLTSNSAGCSLSGRTLSFTQDGSCTVTASVTATDTYDAVSSVKTFAVSKAAQPVSWSPSASLTLVNLSASLGAASTSGDGSITYSATSSGSENCRIPDNTSPVLHYDAAGSCTVVATAALTTGYAQGTQSAVITISLATPTVSWSPETALTMPAATVTPTAATTTGDGAFTYAVTSGTNCTVDTNTGVITYTAAGSCQITATSQATSRYTAGSTAATFTVSLASQTITAAASSTTLRPRGTTTVSSSGSTGSGTITWTNTTPAVCTLTGTTVTADANGSCVLTVSIAADATFAAASDSITIAVTTPPPPAGGGGSGGSGGSSGGGSSGSGGGSSSSASSGGSGSGSSGGAGASGGSGGAAQSQDDVAVPGTGATTRGRALPPPPTGVDVQPLRSGARSSVLIKQPVGAAGAQVLATVVVVRNAKGKVISRINIELEPGQTQTRVTVPYVADGYTVDVYNVNEVGVSTGALTRSPLVRATTITKRTSSGQPRLFGEMLGKPIIFNGGSATLDKKDKKRLRAIAREAKKSNERLFVTGFARKGGGSASELASLSTKRARAAARYLSKRGVRVWIRYWGAGSLNGTGSFADRRVEVRTSAAPIPRTLVP